MAQMPRISNMLARFEPTTLPKANSGWPDMAELADTISSGIDVPIETIVKPMTMLGIRNFLAMELEPSTRNSAPYFYMAKPNTISNIVINIFSSIVTDYRICLFLLKFKYN